MVYNENLSQLEFLVMKNLHFCTCLLAALLVPCLALAQSSENWTQVNLSVTDNHVIPGYISLENAAAGMATAAQSFCRSPDAAGLDVFRNGFHNSMDAWQQIQHIQFGPITYFNWNFRIHYWPDEKGTGARQLDDLIDAMNNDSLAADNFARESVGVQGFPALERLLFDDESLLAFREDNYRCQVAQAIALNISDIASGVSQRWRDEFRTTIENADERGFFESAEDATIDFLKAQIEPVRRIQQQKVEEVIGDSVARARIRRAESWRSNRSLRNLRLNVLALENLFSGNEEQAVALGAVLMPEDRTLISDAFRTLKMRLEAAPDSIEEALDAEGGYAQLQQIAAGLDDLFEAFEAGLKNTELYLGFNSLDGD